MIPNKFEYIRPNTLQEALSILSAYREDAKVLAGGQSLLSLMKLRLASPKYLIDLSGVPELNYIREESGRGNSARIAIGALTTYAQIKESAVLQAKSPLLVQTTHLIGDVQVRNRGTLGGSLAHADPAGDMPAAILALGAEIKAVGPKGARWIKAEDFFVTAFTTALSFDEIVAEVRVPVLKGYKTAYMKNAPRPSDFAIVGVAVCLQPDGGRTCQNITIGITGVTDKAYRAVGVEESLRGKQLDPKIIEQAASRVTDGVEVNGNIHASKEFRSYLASIWVKRAIQAAMSGA
ncbi:MAG: xanthine dehydrogenase family protein subunit M [Acidobacteria bacterium]|nr:xanthine dehydrogenase family protein subunit M [Acidobacteriota bacterium]